MLFIPGQGAKCHARGNNAGMRAPRLAFARRPCVLAVSTSIFSNRASLALEVCDFHSHLSPQRVVVAGHVVERAASNRTTPSRVRNHAAVNLRWQNASRVCPDQTCWEVLPLNIGSCWLLKRSRFLAHSLQNVLEMRRPFQLKPNGSWLTTARS